MTARFCRRRERDLALGGENEKEAIFDESRLNSAQRASDFCCRSPDFCKTEFSPCAEGGQNVTRVVKKIDTSISDCGSRTCSRIYSADFTLFRGLVRAAESPPVS